MEQIGTVARLQVQRQPLKEDGRYDPSGLMEVPEAVIGPAGMLGFHDGAWIVDTHHAEHPRRRGGGGRALSFGFTAHYAAMRERFGGVVAEGVAGENVIIGSDLAPTAYRLRHGLAIAGIDGDLVELTGFRPAAPCAEFTSYLLGLGELASRSEVAAELEFLDEGTRGFIAGAGGAARHIRRGAAVFLL